MLCALATVRISVGFAKGQNDLCLHQRCRKQAEPERLARLSCLADEVAVDGSLFQKAQLPLVRPLGFSIDPQPWANQMQ